MQIEFENQLFEFPDDATEDEIASTLDSLKPKAVESKESSALSRIAESETFSPLKKLARDISGEKPDPERAGNVARMLGQSANAVSESLPSALLNTGAMVLNAPNAALQAMGVPIGDNPIATTLEESAGNYARRAKEKRPDTSKEAPFMAGVINAPESLLTNIGGVALAGPLGAEATLANRATNMMGAVVAGQSYGEAREKGVSGAEASVFGVAQGATEKFFEQMPMGKLLSDVKARTGFTKMLTNQLAREIPTEQITTVVQDLNDWAVLNPEKTFQDYIAERPDAALTTLGATIAQTGAMTGIAKGLESLTTPTKEQMKTQNEVQQEVENLARDMGLLQDDSAEFLGTESFPISHQKQDQSFKLPKAIPMFENSDGTLSNVAESETATQVYAPVSGANVRIVEGDVTSAIKSGELEINSDLKNELETSTFADADKAANLAGLIQLKASGVEFVHQVNEDGVAKTLNLGLLDAENLVADFQSLKSPDGFKVEGEFITSASDVDYLADETSMTREQELVYKILNPITAERKAEIKTKLERKANLDAIPDAENPVALQSLDDFWKRGVETDLFASQQSPDVGGITDDVVDARQERFSPEILPPSLRTIEVASVKPAEGLTLKKLDKQPGTFGIGGNNRNFPREYQEAVVALTEAVRTKYMAPDAMIIVNFENFGTDNSVFGKEEVDETGAPIKTTMGAHVRLDDGTHVITPRELAAWDEHKSAYNRVTVNEAIYSLSHELGHAVWLNEFFRNMDVKVAGHLNNLLAMDDIEGIKEILDLIPNDEAEVLREWISMREKVQTESARWFVENWLGVRKLAVGVGKYRNKHQQRIYEWTERELGKRGLRLDGASALDVVHSIAWDERIEDESERRATAERYILSFNEYMAEQFSRHVYKSQVADSVLAKNAFFMRALNALRDFFRSLKTTKGENAESVVKPGAKFEEWIGKLSLVRASAESQDLAKQVNAKSKRKIVSKAKKSTTGKSEKSAPKADEIVPPEPMKELTLVEDAAIVKTLRGMVPLMRREDPASADELSQLIEFGQYEDAQNLIQNILGKKVSFDVTYSYRFMDRLRAGKKKDTDNYTLGYLYSFAQQSGVKANEKAAILEMVEDAKSVVVSGKFSNDWADINVPSSLVEMALESYFGQVTPKVSSKWSLNTRGWALLDEDQSRVQTLFFDFNNLSHNIPTHAKENGPVYDDKRQLVRGDVHVRFVKMLDTKRQKVIMKIGEMQSDLVQRYNAKNFKSETGDTASMFPKYDLMIRALQKSFDERFVREVMAWASDNGFDEVWLAHENTTSVMEGHLNDVERRVRLRTQTEEEALRRATIDREAKLVEVSSSRVFPDEMLTGSFDAPAQEDMTTQTRTLYDEKLETFVYQNKALIRNNKVFLVFEYKEGLIAFFDRDALVEIAVNDPSSVDFVDDMLEIISQVESKRVMVNKQNLDKVYIGNRNRRTLMKTIFGGELVLDTDLGTAWHKAETNPMYRMISLDTTKPGSTTAKKAIANIAKLKDVKLTKSANFTARLGIALRQLQQLANENPELLPLQLFNQLQQKYTTMKSQLLFRPQQVADEWIRLSKKEGELLESLMKSEQEIGTHMTELAKNGALYVHRTSPKFEAWLTENGVDLNSESGVKIRDLFLQIKNAHLHQLNTLEAVIRDKLWQRFKRETDVFAARWSDFKPLFDKMRKTVFLPNMQFGDYVVYVTEPVEQDNGRMKRETTYRRHFESESERDKFYNELKKRAKPNQSVMMKTLKESETVTLTIPYDFLQAVSDTGAFAPPQIELMAELLIPARVEKFEKRWEAVANTIPGGSENLFRNFAAHTWHNANFIAKLKYNGDMNSAIAQMRTEFRVMNEDQNADASSVRRAELIMDNMIETKDYVMHPPAEMEAARTGISLTYLAFSVKTALMNFSTMLHTVYGVQVEYGDVKGTKAFLNTFTMLKGLWGKDNKRGGKDFGTLESKIQNSTGKEQARWKAIKFAMDKAVQDGVIDQSYAYMLAGIATSGTRMKLYQQYPSMRWAHGVFDAGMWLFRTVEKTNRLVSLMTFFELEYAKTGNESQAYEHAVKRTLSLQNDYTRANRLKVTRKNMAIFTIFLSYSQFMGWLTTGGHDRTLRAEEKMTGESRRGSPLNFTMRLWITYALLGGMMGLPFAENIMDLLTFLARRFGIADPEYFLRKFIADVTNNENTVMHGLLSNVGGVDVSGSFGLGRLIPGTEPIQRAGEMQFLPFVGEEISALTGVFGSFMKSMWEMAGEDDFTSAMRKAPGALGHIGKSIDDYENGIMTAKGVRLNRDPETGEFIEKDASTAALEVLGFQIAEVAKARRQNTMSSEIAKYYAYRQQMLMANWNKARLYQDRESEKDANADIERFNKQLPSEFRALAITGKTKMTSFKRYQKSVRGAEMGRAPARKQQGVYDAVQDVTDE